MKKIILSLVLLFGILFIGNVFALGDLNQNNIDILEKQNENLKISIKKIDVFLIKYNYKKNKNIEYYKNIIKNIKYKKQILNNEINILYTVQICREISKNCIYETEFFTYTYNKGLTKKIIKNLIKEREELIEEFDNDIFVKEKILFNLEQEEVEWLLKLKEKQIKKSDEYIKKAEYSFNEWKFKDAISWYKTSCQYVKTYKCFYWLWISNYKLAQKYNENIKNYWYEILFNKTKNEAIKNLNLAIDITDSEDNKNTIKVLINEIENYPVKEKKEIVELEKKDDLDKKVDLIFVKLELITAKYSEEEKIKLYKNLIPKLEKYNSKNKNNILKKILNRFLFRLKKNL